MTVAAGPVRTPLNAASYDHAVSDAAKRISEILQELVQFPDPYSASSSKGEALDSLKTVYLQSSRPNWDGQNSAPVVPATVNYAKHFLGLLPSRFPQPDVYAEPDGEIAFEWDFGPRKIFSVSVGRDGTLTYAGLFGPNRTHGVESMVDRIPEAIRVALDRITS